MQGLASRRGSESDVTSSICLPTSSAAPLLGHDTSLHAVVEHCETVHTAGMNTQRAAWRLLRGIAPTTARRRNFSQVPSRQGPTASIPMPYITEVTVRLEHAPASSASPHGIR